MRPVSLVLRLAPGRLSRHEGRAWHQRLNPARMCSGKTAGKGASLLGRHRGTWSALADALVNGVPPLPGGRAAGGHSRAPCWISREAIRALKNIFLFARLHRPPTKASWLPATG